MRLLIALVIIAAIGAAATLFVTRPQALSPDRFTGLVGDADAGERIFNAGGCASCHKAPESDDTTALPGGMRFATDFGTFTAPNISPDREHGIGGWTLAEFGTAMKMGVSPEGQHYYPAFPYTTYARMTDEDVADLWAYLQTLPPQAVASQPHELGFPFSIRATLGPWKFLNLDKKWIAPEGTPGRYLVEALGHCAECHTPRNAIGALDQSAWLGGAALPSGDGKVPSLHPDDFDWSAGDIAYYLETGFTPDFDSAGGEMASVVTNMSKLPTEDREAIAAYLKAMPFE